MEFNKNIKQLLNEYHIKQDAGLLYLLGIYYGLNADEILPQDFINQVNLTGIFEKDYVTNTIKWNYPLFEGQEIGFEWVVDWNNAFGKINPGRKGSSKDVMQRMKHFFAQFPEYRKEDVYAARDEYFKTVDSPGYLKSSQKFIYEGSGVHRTYPLLQWCEKIKDTSIKTHQIGKVM